MTFVILRFKWHWISCVLMLSSCGGGGGNDGSGTTSMGPVPAPTIQELQCQAAGWTRDVSQSSGLHRLVLWKAPATWSRGAIVVMHGGGGSHNNFCVANVSAIRPQVNFTDLALARGFAVFLLDSSDQIRDNAGRICGKVWDDEVRNRANLDLPFIEDVLRRLIPAKRPVGSRDEIFVAGHSSGGFMTVRAASQYSDLVTAFVPVASGDPYGWTRDCTPLPSDRTNVFGAGFDNETGLPISTVGACNAPGYPNEKPWDDVAGVSKPAFRHFHHAQDGINDLSCVDKVRSQLVTHGYPETPPFRLSGGPRSSAAHAWLDSYNAPILDFFELHLP